MTVSAVIVGGDMARACFNALAFLPAASSIKVARLDLSPEKFTATATDGYAVGMAWCPVTEYQGPPEGVTFDVPRGGSTKEGSPVGLAELDGAGRKDNRGKGLGLLSYDLESGGVVYAASDGTETVVPAPADLGRPEGLWEAVDGLLERLERRAPVVPGVIAFGPELLSRFSKVKADRDMRVMDCYMTDNLEPMLVKIGTDFLGAIMPIDRSDHAEKIGEEGLWETA